MRRQYSRLARVEEKQNIRQAIIFGGLSIALLVFLAFFGIPIIAKLAGAISNIKNGKTVQQTSSNPIAAPQLNNLPDFVNKADIEISGSAQPDTKISVFINNAKEETTSKSSGDFSISATLVKGENDVYAKAEKDNSSSDESNHIKITFDNEAPKLELNKPTDGQSFFGDKQKQISIEGKTESDAQLTINGRVVIVEDDGNFKYNFTLSEGSNNLDIAAIDRAGNQKEMTISVNYSP